jgi:hypothetical protein
MRAVLKVDQKVALTVVLMAEKLVGLMAA